MRASYHRAAAQTAPLLTVETVRVGRRMVLAVSGEIDIATVDDLGDAIDAVIDDGAVEVWVDLTPAEFMDSTGLRLLVAAGDRLRALNRSLAVICPPGAIRRTIELAGLHEVLPVFRDRTAAQRG